jgi:hypothetical protein
MSLGNNEGCEVAFTWARFLSRIQDIPQGASSPRPIRDLTHTHSVRGNQPRPLVPVPPSPSIKGIARQDFRAAERGISFTPTPRAVPVTPIPYINPNNMHVHTAEAGIIIPKGENQGPSRRRSILSGPLAPAHAMTTLIPRAPSSVMHDYDPMSS